GFIAERIFLGGPQTNPLLVELLVDELDAVVLEEAPPVPEDEAFDEVVPPEPPPPVPGHWPGRHVVGDPRALPVAPLPWLNPEPSAHAVKNSSATTDFTVHG